ncbi:MAG: hypothetical protein PHU85_18630 [Phycisphaerae bacterium]|nr:hypothetical protein [Phycisphaerae bacterium]
MCAIRVTLWVIAVLAAAPADARDIYRSDFGAAASQPAESADWKFQGGRYRFEAGWLRVASDSSNPEAMLRATHDGDGTYRALVRNAEHCHRTIMQAVRLTLPEGVKAGDLAVMDVMGNESPAQVRGGRTDTPALTRTRVSGVSRQRRR